MAEIAQEITAVADHPQRYLAKATTLGGLAPALSALIVVAVSSMPIGICTALPLFNITISAASALTSILQCSLKLNHWPPNSLQCSNEAGWLR